MSETVSSNSFKNEQEPKSNEDDLNNSNQQKPKIDSSSGQSSDQERETSSPESNKRSRKHSAKCKLSQSNQHIHHPHLHHHHHHHHSTGTKDQSTEEVNKMSQSSKSQYATATDELQKSKNDQKTFEQQLQILVNTVDTNVSKLVDKEQQTSQFSSLNDGQVNLGYQTSIHNPTQSNINKSTGTGGAVTHTLTLSKSHNYPNHCHTSNSAHPGIDRSARKKLIFASLLCLLFMIGETVGGLLANSLAIATDAAHLLTDFASFMISLFSIWMASRPATKKMSFGYYRAEVIGALTSVLLIWVVTGILVLMAIQRLISGSYEIDAPIMLITAGIGVIVNIM